MTLNRRPIRALARIAHAVGKTVSIDPARTLPILRGLAGAFADTGLRPPAGEAKRTDSGRLEIDGVEVRVHLRALRIQPPH